ncbi:g12135 [Coccomyxa viridis]|uniref:G12135 protein n=1 Tax=Coccomyxa viridis TaxID=1274662 RepID=A0ABP1GGL7_9CHLO
MGNDTSSIPPADAMPLGCDGVVHIKTEPRNGTPMKGGALMGAPDIGGPGGTAVTGLENGQGYAGRVKFGIPEWGSPLPGMAPAPLQKPRSMDVHVRAPAAVSPVRPMTPADHGARKALAEPSTQSPQEEPVEPVAGAMEQKPSKLPAQAAAQAPPHAPAQPPHQAPVAPPAAPASLTSAKLPEQQNDDAPADTAAAPRQEQKGIQTPRRAQRDVAALDELHAYVMSCGGTLEEGWTVQFQKRGNGHARPTYLPPKGFTSADSAEHKGSFTEKHLVVRALGLMPPGSRGLRRLDSKSARDAAGDRDTDADLAPELDSGPSGDQQASDEMSNGADRMEVDDQDGEESEDAGDTAAADDAAAAEELAKLREYVKDCGGALPAGWSVRRIRCFGDRHRPLYVAPEDFLAVPGQPSKSTYSSKAQVAAALGWGSSRRSEKKSAAKAASAATEEGPSEAPVPVPKSKKQRTLHAIGAAAADEAPVINIRSTKAPPTPAPPSQHAAIGWRVRVRAQHDRRRMTEAVVRDYDPPTGQYQLRLEGGGEEWRHLTDNVRWISASPLEESSSALSTSDEASSDDSEEAESDGSEPIPAPPVRQKKAAKRSLPAVPAAEEPDLALVEAPARAGTPLTAGPISAPAAVGRTGPYQGAWNKYKTGIPEKDTEVLYECMAEIGVHLAPGWTSSYVTTVRRGKPEKDICYCPPPGFKAVSGVEGRMYWSRPDVARAHGATNWPQRCAPRGTLTPIPTAAKAVAPEGAAASPDDEDSGDLEEQKEWLQDFLNEEFEKAGWGDGSIAWQDVAKRKSDLSNNDIFQKVKALNKRAEEKHPLLKDVCGKDGTAVIKKKIMMLFVNASKRARKRLQNGIEEPPRSIVPAMSQRQAPGPAAAKAPAPPQVVRRAIEKPPEQPHVQFPDDSPYMARGPQTSHSPPQCADSYQPYQQEQHSNPTSPSLKPLEHALMRMPDMSVEVADKQLEARNGQAGQPEQAKRTVAEHFFFFLKQPGATPEFLQELHRLAQNAM